MDSNYSKLLHLATKCRQYQNQFYREKRKDALPKAIHYEKKLDEIIKAIKELEKIKTSNAGRQANIFDQGGSK
jgi:hypothetical protein